MFRYGKVGISYLEHDCFRLEAGGRTLYTDPFRIGGQPKKADVVTISHDHFDHLSVEDLSKVVTSETSVIASVNCEGKVNVRAKEKVFLKPGEAVEVKGFKVKAVPAYNVNKFRAPGQPFHPRSYNGLGYLLEAEGVRVYHAGDTDAIDEMGDMGEVDVALLPVSGTYVMTADEAVQAVRLLKPKVAVPMHWGAIVGGRADAERFVAAASKITRAELIEKERGSPG
jgi:L-ascorbate metabolism protein UlaG (beta-lactamase superfamily)